MTTNIKVPVLPESVADATVAKWHKKPGDAVKRDETLVDIETDKVVLEVPAPEDGVLAEIVADEGTTVKAEEVIGKLNVGGASSKETNAAIINGTITKKEKTEAKEDKEQKSKESVSVALSPSARRLVAEKDLDIEKIKSGKSGKIEKEDVLAYLHQKQAPTEKKSEITESFADGRAEQRVAMSRLRARIAERLLSAQHNMAILTTFNEINMQAVMDLRKQYKDQFEKAHNARLGFMSFFIKAAVAALKRFPDVNAFIDGTDIVYHGYCDIGVAVSTERGLVVPILRDVDRMSMADIENKIVEFAEKARTNKLTIDEMTGGTFSITNGGVFGSLLSTPIINPPQSAILGLHKIEERPVVENGQIVARPMMYVALSYDHRIIDGKDSVQFLKTIKELIEDPARLLLDV